MALSLVINALLDRIKLLVHKQVVFPALLVKRQLDLVNPFVLIVNQDDGRILRILLFVLLAPLVIIV